MLDQSTMQSIEQQYTLIRSTTLLVVRRAAYTGLVTDAVNPVTIQVTRSNGVITQFEYEQHFSTEQASINGASRNDHGNKTGFMIGLSVGLLCFVILGALLFFLFRRRRRKLADRETIAVVAASGTRKPKPLTANSSWRSRSTPSPHPYRTTRSPNSNTHRQPPTQTTRSSTPEQVPHRSDTGTPIAELGTAIIPNKNISTLFQMRRSAIPPLPRLKIDRTSTRHPSAFPASPELVSCITPGAPMDALLSLTPISPPSTARLNISCFPYGYQSEFPEVSSGPSIPRAAAVLGPMDRQQEMRFLAEEERLVRERMRATEELIRLKDEEARILDRKKQLRIGR